MLDRLRANVRIEEDDPYLALDDVEHLLREHGPHPQILGRVAVLQRKLWKEREKASKEKVLAGGVEINEIPDKSAFQAAMKPVYDKYLEQNPNLKPLVEMIQNTP